MLNSDHIFTSLITLCIGFIIAFGLQRIVDLILRRRRDRRQQEAEARSTESDGEPPSAPPR